MRIKTLFPNHHRFIDLLRNRAGRAQGMVEFALVLPVLLTLVFGIIEVGRLLFIYSAVMTASREAARFGSAAGENSGVLQFNDCAGIEAAAHRVGILADITSVVISYDTGPGTATLTGGCPTDPKNIEGGKHRVIVQVNATYQPIVPLVNVNSFNFQSTSARTIFSNVQVGVFPANPLHVAALTYSPVPPSACGHNEWCTNVFITVRDAEGNLVDGATVTGSWCNNNCTGSCTTVGGQCSIPVIYNKNKSATFTVDDIIHPLYGYDNTSNTKDSELITKP